MSPTRYRLIRVRQDLYRPLCQVGSSVVVNPESVLAVMHPRFEVFQRPRSALEVLSETPHPIKSFVRYVSASSAFRRVR